MEKELTLEYLHGFMNGMAHQIATITASPESDIPDRMQNRVDDILRGSLSTNYSADWLAGFSAGVMTLGSLTDE